jgi:hypothetical protein
MADLFESKSGTNSNDKCARAEAPVERIGVESEVQGQDRFAPNLAIFLLRGCVLSVLEYFSHSCFAECGKRGIPGQTRVSL